jgi:hypothetical protein
VRSTIFNTNDLGRSHGAVRLALIRGNPDALSQRSHFIETYLPTRQSRSRFRSPPLFTPALGGEWRNWPLAAGAEAGSARFRVRYRIKPYVKPALSVR